MCGIVGFWGTSPTIPSRSLEAMAKAIRHRGPDDTGFAAITSDGAFRTWKRAGEAATQLEVGLGFQRLAILDLSPNGAQPMSTEDGRFTLIFNGQIYNYVELKRELPESVFRSTSDTEVLLRLFQKEGIRCLEKLDGMFAFACFDAVEKKLWLARDPVGIKPLYYCENEVGLFFASEIRALIAGIGKKPTLNHRLLGRYLRGDYLPDPHTLFTGIQRLESGHWLCVQSGHVTEKRQYWDFCFARNGSGNLDRAAQRLDEALDTAVERQLRSDVGIGFFLSGGIDSSLLLAKALKRVQRPTAFTIGFRWPQSQGLSADLESARLLARSFSFEAKEIWVEPDIVTVLPKVIEALEEPINDPAAVCSYLICEAAKGYFKVLWSGQGADELFGGYPIYQAARVAGFLPPTIAKGVEKLPYSWRGRPIQAIHRIRKMAYASQREWPERFLALRGSMTEQELRQLVTFDPLPAFAVEAELVRVLPAQGYEPMMYLDAKTYLPSNNLTYSDKTSMAHSIELRVPYLARAVVEAALHTPHHLKLDLLGGKRVLKKVAERYLPHAVIHRPKAGFGVPLKEWFYDNLQPLARDLLSSDRLKRQGLWNVELPTRWLDEHRARRADHCKKLYGLLTLQLWAEHFELF